MWTFNTIPRPGEFGNDTWENGSWATNGNTGIWTQMSADEDLGLSMRRWKIRLPTTMAAIAPATISSAIPWYVSISRPVSVSGITR